MQFKLGDELLMGKYHYPVEGKKVGLVTNQSGVNMSTLNYCLAAKKCNKPVLVLDRPNLVTAF